MGLYNAGMGNDFLFPKEKNNICDINKCGKLMLTLQ